MSKKENIKREQHTALIAKIEAYQKAFDEKFSEIEATEDSAEKILKLRVLDRQINPAIYDLQENINYIVKKRARHTAKTYFKKAGLVVASLPIFTIPVYTVDASWVSLSSVDDKLRELRQVVDINGFNQRMNEHLRCITKMLDETVKGCDLNEISKSPHFSDALHSHGPLKKRFDAAAIARAALGEEEQPKAAMADRQGPRLRPGGQG